MKRFIITILILAAGFECLARHPKVRNFAKETYKAGQQTWCMEQDWGGNMYFANAGVLEYDGMEWTLSQTVNRSTARSLLYDDKSGRIYFGAANEFGYIYNDDKNQRKYVSLSEGAGVTMEDIWGLHLIDGYLWLRESNNIYKSDFQHIKQFSFPDKISTSAEIGSRFLIFVNNHGVFELDSQEQFREVEGTAALKNKRVVSIIPYEGRPMFVCADGDIFTLQDDKLKEFHHGLTDNIAEATIYCARTDGRYLALGTVRDGVYILNLQSGHEMHLNTYSGLQNNTVLSMFFDKDGNLWLGLDKGIDLVELSSTEYSLFGNSDRFGSGYASAVFDGELWLGTNQGLYHAPYEAQGDIPADNAFISVSKAKGQVWSLLVWDEHLFCCHDRGIYIIKDGRCRHIAMNGAWKLERLKDWPQYMLGSSYDRLFLLKKDGRDWNFDCWIEGFDDATKAFEAESDGTIWFSHWIKGLFRLDLDMETKSITDQKFMSRSNGFPEDWSNIPIEIDNEIIFTTTRGFYGFDKYSEKAYPLERMNTLFNTPPSVTGVYVSPYDYAYYSSSSLQAVTYKDENGNEFIDSLSLKGLTAKRLQGFEEIRALSPDEILVNTDEGFSIVRLDQIKEHKGRNNPQVYIKEICSDTGTCLYSSTDARRDSTASLSLSYNSNTLKVKAAYPVYENENGVEFSFMLENYDKQWSQFSESNRKEYTRLPHGTYTLRVRAKDNLHTDVSETSVVITIDAPWYFSKAAIMIYILSFILFIWLIYRLLYRYSIKRARLMSMKKEEELRKKQMKLDLEHKAEDLAASTMNVIRKNEILLEIDTELEKVAENMSEDRNKSLKILSRIRHQIHDNIQHDNAWKTFEQNFDVVYDDYLKRLSQKYPHLTMADKKMCAYLKMDLSSKEIAPLLNITVRSVEMTRYRLRKKLGLSREDNLTEFLQKF